MALKYVYPLNTAAEPPLSESQFKHGSERLTRVKYPICDVLFVVFQVFLNRPGFVMCDTTVTFIFFEQSKFNYKV